MNPISYRQLLERFFQIKCKNDYISRIAPRDIIAETAIMCEKVFYIDIYLPATKIIENFKAYTKKVSLNFTGDNSLTIGFFLYWFSVDPEMIKHVLTDSVSADSVINESASINSIRNRSLHKNKDFEVVVTAQDSTKCVESMELIIRELYKQAEG